MAGKKRAKKPAGPKRPDHYTHPMADGTRVPDAGAQPYIPSKPATATYRFDSSLDPALSWDEGNPEREQAEALIRAIQEANTLDAAKAAAAKLRAMSGPFLNWAGKAERPSLDVPTLPCSSTSGCPPPPSWRR